MLLTPRTTRAWTQHAGAQYLRGCENYFEVAYHDCCVNTLAEHCVVIHGSAHESYGGRNS